MISFGSSLIFSSFGNAAARAQRLKMPVSQVVQSVSNKKLLPKQRYIILEVCAVDSDSGDDIDIPSIRFKLPTRAV
jgi:ubiquitin-activating enzyme E1